MDEIYYAEYQKSTEVELKDLFWVIWKKKIKIISVTLIVAIITGIISVFFITPVYHSRLNIIINMPETYHTKYGDYALPISTNEQYINLITSNDILVRTLEDMGYNDDTTIESLRNRIKVYIPESSKDDKKEYNSFEIDVSADNPEEARKLAMTLFENYTEFLDMLIIEGALNFHINRFNVEISTLEVSLERTKEILAKNEALLTETPQTINQKEAMDEIYNSPNISDYVILEKVINPNYTKIETDIIENKQAINGMENSIKTYKKYLKELNEVKESIETYKSNGYFDIINGEFKSITKTNVYLPSSPIAPSRKSSPNNLMNVVISAFLTGIVSVVCVLIKEFWFENK